MSVGPGVSDKSIKIGIYTAQGASDLFKSVGIKAADLGNMLRQAQAVVGWVNANGGAGGRKLEIVPHEVDIAAAETASQAACAAFTQDTKVFAVVSPLGDDQLWECLAKANTMAISNADPPSPAVMRRLGPYRYVPSSFNPTRAHSALVRSLLEDKWFDGKSPVGVVLEDKERYRAAVRDAIRPQLEAAGISVVEGVVDPSSSQAIQAFVLRMKNAGVKELILMGGGYGFMATAPSQNYFPKYAFTSEATPAIVAQNVTPRSMQGFRGIGWVPSVDVLAAQDDRPLGARQTLCRKILKDAGEDIAQRSVDYIGSQYCDAILFLKDSLDAAAAPNATEFQKAVQALGTTMPSALTFSTRFGPGRANDGGEGFRPIAFDQGCSCIRYVGPVVPLG